jgi:di/tricarboxylate transporter
MTCSALTVEHLKQLFAFAICLIWLIAILVSLFTHEYAVVTAISPVMLTVSGFLFGSKEAPA